MNMLSLEFFLQIEVGWKSRHMHPEHLFCMFAYYLIHNSRPDKYLSVNVKKRVFLRKKNRIEIQEVTLPKGGAVDNLRKKGAIFGSRYILR